jgi:hypothetical protein
MIEKSTLYQDRSSMPIVLPWIAPVLACLPSTIILYVVKAGRNEHQSYMSNFKGPSKYMEIFGDCLLLNLMWETCATARTKGSLTKMLSDLRFLHQQQQYKIESSCA